MGRVVPDEQPSRHAQPDDARTLEVRALDGDEVAWNALIERHGRRVVLALLARGERMSRAHELANEAWMKLIERQREGRLTRLELPGLAIRQAAFLATDAHRRKRLDEADDGDAAMARVGDDAATPEQRAIDRQTLDRVLAELERCSPRAREVFTLVYAEQLTPAQAGERLGISTQRVRQTVCEVRARLRGALEEGR